MSTAAVRGPKNTLTVRSPRPHWSWKASLRMCAELESWGFAEGDEIAPRRRAVSLLGGGYRYEAWLAWDEHIRSLVVAKVIRPDQTDDAVARRTLAREAAMLIRRYGLILEQAVPLALNLCSVLHYLAEEGVVHLDVKPRNIIMAGSPRLIDLSVARGVEELDSVHGPIGTDAYMAPEQCDPDRRAEIGPPADVWGLGVTVHEAFTGELPYPRPSRDVRYPQLAHRPRVADGVPPKLRPLVLTCLEPRPEDRPRAGELGDALEPFVAALPAPKIGRFRPGGQQLMERLEAS